MKAVYVVIKEEAWRVSELINVCAFLDEAAAIKYVEMLSRKAPEDVCYDIQKLPLVDGTDVNKYKKEE